MTAEKLVHGSLHAVVENAGDEGRESSGKVCTPNTTPSANTHVHARRRSRHGVKNTRPHAERDERPQDGARRTQVRRVVSLTFSQHEDF